MRGDPGSHFSRCPNCGHRWTTRDNFLEDRQLQLVGYQVNFDHLDTGLFLFNHSCNTTLSIKAGAFQDLYHGPIFQESKKGTAECPAYCLKKSELAPCPAKCECSFVREIIQIILGWKKRASSAS